MTAGYSHETPRWQSAGAAPWLDVVNRVVALLQRLGFVVGSRYLLAIQARQSGVLRSTLVSVVSVEGERYVVSDKDDAEWARDARAAGRGILRRGQVDEHVTLIEVPIGERATLFRTSPALIPGGISSSQQGDDISADPDATLRLAMRCPVFRLERRG